MSLVVCLLLEVIKISSQPISFFFEVRRMRRAALLLDPIPSRPRMTTHTHILYIVVST